MSDLEQDSGHIEPLRPVELGREHQLGPQPSTRMQPLLGWDVSGARIQGHKMMGERTPGVPWLWVGLAGTS